MKHALWMLGVAACFSTPARPTDDAATPPMDDGVTPADYNTMFVTSTRTMSSVLSKSLADSICMSAASNGGRDGTFVAWFSDTAGDNMLVRLGTSRGWVRTDGQPFADTPMDIAMGNIFYPPRKDEHGAESFIDQQFVATGTRANGSVGATCPVNGTITFGVNDAAAPLWSDVGELSCSTMMKLYCFETGKVRPLAIAPPSTAKLAFVSTPVFVMSLDQLDEHCIANAAAAGYPNRAFVAFVPLTTRPAEERLPKGTSWYRPDGVRVVSDSRFTELEAPIHLEATGARVASDTLVRFGAVTPAIVGTDTCSDWTSQSTIVGTGETVRSSRSAFSNNQTQSCAGSGRVYCFEL